MKRLALTVVVLACAASVALAQVDAVRKPLPAPVKAMRNKHFYIRHEFLYFRLPIPHQGRRTNDQVGQIVPGFFLFL